jgi:hypothetical protein
MKFPFELTIRDAVAIETTLRSAALAYEEAAREKERYHLHGGARLDRLEAAQAHRLADVMGTAINVATGREAAL